MSTLKAQQQWLMQQILNGEHGNRHNISPSVNHMLAGTKTFSAAEGLAIYQQGYYLRLIECLEAEFPVLKLYLGDALFSAFARSYISQLPSTHFNLYQLGERFADFLQATRPKSDNSRISYLHLPEQLAYTERAQAESMRANSQIDTTSEAPVHSTQPIPPMYTLMQAPALTQFALPATSRLVNVDFDLLGYLQAAEAYFGAQHTASSSTDTNSQDAKSAQTRPEKPTITSQTLLVFRADAYRDTQHTMTPRFHVNIGRLSTWQAAVIKAIKEQKKPDWKQLAVDACMSEVELWLKVAQWLSLSVKQGMISKIHTI